MEMEEDFCIFIILRRPFLATVEVMIDVKNGRLSLQVGDEKVEFHLPQTIANPTLDDTCCRIDVLEKVLNKEALTYHSMKDPPDAALISCGVSQPQVKEKEEYAKLLNASTAYTHKRCCKEVLNVEAPTSQEKGKSTLQV